ncbi:uncharacterized protein PHALS_13838 [Plasmopara halstedii]|uniref:Uncharacterized protein n=1 Tax=Plasmopara halstedii TaxID=4781 RepID=A0A0P1AQ43_PLAHL|nr:uncharacterized protein PHALS_13838 [Plasmopara halstedii]CEG43646.1 hypothetical protein PHALS_13838 [Plasmopara halstedii]|eukprot:XP_024580015.1 hypothetical protein PHALS_13838 [Plasmopara halstedii]
MLSSLPLLPLPPPSTFPALSAAVPADAVDPDDELIDATPNAANSAPNAAAAALDDESMDLTQPLVNSAPPPSVDTRPTMADLLRQQETIRRDNAKVEAARRRVETPKPLACDIEAIELSTPLVVTGRSSRPAWSRRYRMSSRAPNTAW